MKINKYPDGTSYVEVDDDEKHETVFKINSYEDLHHLEQFVDAFNHKFNEMPTIVIPNLLDAQADRRFEENQSSGLKLVCNRLNLMYAKFKIFHPHNTEVVEALIDDVEIIDNSYLVAKVMRDIDRINRHSIVPLTQNLILMSSDAGGFKPLVKICDKLEWKGEIYSALKSRHPIKHTLTQVIDREDFEGKDILIIDDISVFGGTFKGLAKILRTKNCGKIYLVVSHMTMQHLGKHPVTDFFDKVYTTNSKFDEYVVGDELEKPAEDLMVIKMW